MFFATEWMSFKLDQSMSVPHSIFSEKSMPNTFSFRLEKYPNTTRFGVGSKPVVRFMKGDDVD
jgi:hypothetical protein